MTKVTIDPNGSPVLKVFDVSDYGAAGDGSDQTDALQSAINSAAAVSGVVYLPPGVYRITTSLQISSTVTLLGAGGRTRATQILGATGSAAMLSVTGHAVRIRELYLNNTGSGRIVSFIASASAFSHQLEGCLLTNTADNASDMVYVSGSYSVVRGNEFDNICTGAYAVHLQRSAAAILINSWVDDNLIAQSGKGILVDTLVSGDEPQGLLIRGNMFINFGAEQITLVAVEFCSIADNVLDQGGVYSIWIVPGANALVRNVAISGNYITTAKNQLEGVAINASTGSGHAFAISVQNNIITFTGYGLYLGAMVTDASVLNNKFSGINHTAVTLNQCRNVVVTGNHFMLLGRAYSLAMTDGPSGGRFIVQQNFLSGNLVNNVSPQNEIMSNNL